MVARIPNGAGFFMGDMRVYVSVMVPHNAIDSGLYGWHAFYEVYDRAWRIKGCGIWMDGKLSMKETSDGADFYGW